MRCINPLKAYKGPRGEITFSRPGGRPELLELPCGQCIECRLERTRQWAVRITHEASLWDENYFATWTYNDQEQPRSLDYKHFQDFMKRLRHEHPGVRHFTCGEYGDINGRAHFHSCLFNIHVPDKTLHSRRAGNDLYTSQTLARTWRHGYITLGALTWESASYVASYCTKKITGKRANDHYQRLDPLTGELYQLEPEMLRMSLKPAIGLAWIQKFKEDVYNYDHVIVNGKPQKPPRYYDKQIEKTEPARLERLKTLRKEKAKLTAHENTTERLKVREQVTKAKLKLKRKTL